MGILTTKLTVYFDEPFWIGIFERYEKNKLSAAKITFGAEPKDAEIYNFLLKHYYDLDFSDTVDYTKQKTYKNPKRLQRSIKKQLSETGVGTKSQQAIKLQHEQNKQTRLSTKRIKAKIKDMYKFEQKRQKKKEKHRGK